MNDHGRRDSENTTRLVDGVHHVTFLTEDMEGLRHAFLRVGPKTVLHPFQMLDGPGPPPPSPMFSRGRMDHFALLAPDEAAFIELRRRIEAEGAADGDVRDMNSHWIMGYFDPDGADPGGDARAAGLRGRRHARARGMGDGRVG